LLQPQPAMEKSSRRNSNSYSRPISNVTTDAPPFSTATDDDLIPNPRPISTSTTNAPPITVLQDDELCTFQSPRPSALKFQTPTTFYLLYLLQPPADFLSQPESVAHSVQPDHDLTPHPHQPLPSGHRANSPTGSTETS
jgi:hypothetical protein